MVAEENAAEVTMRGPRFDDDALLNLASFDAAIALTQTVLGAQVVTADQEIGNGFAILNGNDKDQLCGVPTVFLSWSFNTGDKGEFVSAYAVGRAAGGGVIKAVVNDGGTGIYQQLLVFTQKTAKMGGLVARQGLRKSEYYYNEETKETSNKPEPGFAKATTYYIDTAA